jgi:hypothetical protein
VGIFGEKFFRGVTKLKGHVTLNVREETRDFSGEKNGERVDDG